MNTVGRIIHSIPGRSRIQLPSGISISSGEIEALYRSVPGIYSAIHSCHSNTVLIHHTCQSLPTKSLPRFSVNAVTGPPPSSIKKQLLELGIVMCAFMVEKLFVIPAFPVARLAFLTPATIATLYASRHIIRSGSASLLKPNPDTLTTAALGASLLKGNPQSALLIYLMSSISELLTDLTMNRTRRFIKDMMALDTPYAWLITDEGQEVKVRTDQVKAGDRVIVFQGEKIPFDGTVVSHFGQVDQSMITGEYMPVHVSLDSYVYAGSILTEGKITLEVDKIGEELAVNRMIQLIEEAQEKQAPVQMLTDKFTEKAVPLSFLLAIGIYVATKDWNRVLNMLVIDYVCGVKLSTATAISAAIGKAARKGVLLKGGQTLETLAKVDTLILDKTGTITEGKPVVTDVTALNGFSADEVLSYAASAEEHSSHPLAEAILSEVAYRRIDIPEHEDESIENFVGKGISAKVHDERVIVGSLGFMQDNGVLIKTEAKAGIFVAKERTLLGIIHIDDKIRPGMNRSINRLRRSGVDEVVMLTGDYESSAQQIAEKITLDAYIAEAMPQEKANYVLQLKQDPGRTIMMVGDGINDAPALAYADIGVTMGAQKTDIAMETADVVIHSDNPLLLAEAVTLSRKTVRTIRQNITATLLINTGAIILGTIGFISPIVGAAVHNAATIGVVLNSTKVLLSEGNKYEQHIQDRTFHPRKDQVDHPLPEQYERAFNY
ncbi:MAG: heavy metal translocating P-type ATPase [Bacillus sp. (in: firmicutes)]